MELSNTSTSSHDDGHNVHMIDDHHIEEHQTTSNNNNNTSQEKKKKKKNGQQVVVVVEVQGGPRKRVISYRYKECMKNHAASLGGNARDGCGEFMPCSSDHKNIEEQEHEEEEEEEEKEKESLYCSVCNCHRNFHRKELVHSNINSHDQSSSRNNNHFHPSSLLGYNNYTLPLPPPPPVIMPYNRRHHHHHHNNNHSNINNKRFRTKFSQEQREKMMRFAERAGWKIQKQEESVVQSFCQEIGVKRRVLKVWMHNNKHNLAKKINNINNNNNPPPPSS